MLKFYVKVLKNWFISKPYLVYVWHVVRYWSKLLGSTIPTPVHDLNVKVMDLKFLC